MLVGTRRYRSVRIDRPEITAKDLVSQGLSQENVPVPSRAEMGICSISRVVKPRVEPQRARLIDKPLIGSAKPRPIGIVV